MITPTKELIESLFEDSRIEKIQTAHRYYANQNDILERKREVVGPDGRLVESEFLSNNKLAHPFVNLFVEQKVSYLLAKPFSITSDDQAFADRVTEVFNKEFVRTLRNICRDAVLCGTGWMMIYYDEDGVLQFKRVVPENIGAVYADDEKTELLAVVRRYRYEDDWRYEVWDEYMCNVYEIKDGKLIHIEARGHFDEAGNGFGRIPFVSFAYNARAISLLDFIKPIVDDYDKTSSDLSNLLEDTPNSTRIVKGYSGKVEEIVRNMAQYNLCVLDPDSDLSTIPISVDVTAIEAHMARLRKDMFEAARAVDNQETSLGNLSGVAIKFRYADLDLDCQQLGAEFAASLEKVAWFIADEMGGDHDPSSLDFIWATEIIMNESEVITNLVNSEGILSLKTRVANHPYTTDVDEELEEIKKEKAESDAYFPDAESSDEV